jgi:N-acetylmuramic acid 6-phosphate (MurNAc-6-P) etherase
MSHPGLSICSLQDQEEEVAQAVEDERKALEEEKKAAEKAPRNGGKLVFFQNFVFREMSLVHIFFILH